jgi:hypothetical protein
MEKIYELIESLIKLLQEKKVYYSKINFITKSQQDAIKTSNDELLEKLVNEKQVVIDKLNCNDFEFLNNFNEMKKILNVDDISKANLEMYPKLKIVKELVAEIKKIGNEINETDNINRSSLNKEMEELRGEIEEITSRKKVSNAYANVYKQNEASYYFDRKK